MSRTGRTAFSLLLTAIMLFSVISLFSVRGAAAELTKYKLSYSANYVYLTFSVKSSGNMIYYTTDGSKPDASSAVYKERIKFSSETLIRAQETDKSGKKVSSIKFTLRPRCAKPTISASDPPSGNNILITAETKTSGASIRYTTDGSKPGSSSPLYKGPFEVAPGTRIRLIAYRKGFSSTSAFYSVSTDNFEDYQREVLSLVNKQRKAAGLNSLTLSEELCRAAKVRLSEVEKLFDHTRPDGRKWYSVLEDLDIPRQYSAENLAGGQTTPKEVMVSWMNSPKHKANILKKGLNKLGIVCEEYEGMIYWVQLFTD